MSTDCQIKTRAERMEGAKILELVMFWTFEKRTFPDYVEMLRLLMSDPGFAG